MKGKVLKQSSLLLASAMLVGSLAACGSSDNTEKEPEGTTGTTTETPAVDTTPITYTMLAADPSPDWNQMQDEIGKKITEKTGITLKMDFATDANKVSLVAASGDYPDIISAKGSSNLFVDAGAVLDLTDLIDKYGPNLKKVYGDYWNRLKWNNEDQAIYVIPTYDGVGQTYFDAGGAFSLQHQAVEEAGYPEIKTVQDYEKIIADYVAKHPTTADGKKTIGLSLLADDWRIMISVTNPAFQATGASDDGEVYIDPKTYEATFHYRRPEEKEYFRWLNHMNDIGLLDPESFVQKEDQYKAKIAQGRVVGVIDQKWGFQSAIDTLKKDGNEKATYGFYSVQLDDSTVDHSFEPTGFMGGYGLMISKDAKNPERIIQMLDYLASEEGQIMVNWGFEGEQYNVENGKRVIPQEVQDAKTNDASNFRKTTGIGLWTNYAPHYGDGVKDSTDNYFTTNFPEQIVASYTAEDKKVLEKYGKTTWKDFYPSETEFAAKPWGAAWNLPVPSDSDANIIYNKLTPIVRKDIPEIILSKPSEFDAKWDAFMAELDKNGVTKYEEEYTKYIKERVELWSGQ
ncbi:carbohydrate ABC transporter substrate-binding protein (CUT1 family) [Paenibacillus cellulosilyticus]|uniref:Carbohydrate ABC transporter substrate-binding protein (CUT1 family) n=1 Tax=Paenibacillus cellulosilyticus TaxID=375489 RepID=A0A2V2YAE7_9BACL|nr:ABC transporter substrate-binding protein [Paenibacillus cellulosilyticus]PWV88440.1 carbohydrate ABC transporter substrate-binding protein (CUT1 family) [Paenibacillus cellulosilyticus]QKS44293.1 extracellular solute-binding protein [Paenibacillus cellulosilyticus]